MDELGLSSRSVAGNGTEADIPQASGGSGSGSDPAELTQLTSMSKFARTSKSMAELGISSLATQEPTQFRTRKGSTAGGTRQLVAMKVEVPQGNEEKLKWIMESTSKIAEATEVRLQGLLGGCVKKKEVEHRREVKRKRKAMIIIHNYGKLIEPSVSMGVGGLGRRACADDGNHSEAPENGISVCA
jgi:hypothetical protein